MPAPLRDTMKLDVLMSLSVRDEQGQPMYYETFKKREAERVKKEQEEKEEAEKKAKEEAAAARKKPVKRGGRKVNGRASNAMEEVEEKKAEEASDETDEVKEDEPFMDIGVGPVEEMLSVKCGLTITLRDYQCTTVQWMLDQEEESSNTNMYLWSQLQFPHDSLKYAGKRQSSMLASSSASVSSSASASSAASMTVPPLFYYCPLLQRFRFKTTAQSTWWMECRRNGTRKTIGALAVINVQRRTPTSAEILALEEQKEERVERKKRVSFKQEENSRGARYQRRQSKEVAEEEVKEEMEEDEEEKEKKDDELDGEKVNDEHNDFPSIYISSSPLPRLPPLLLPLLPPHLLPLCPTRWTTSTHKAVSTRHARW